MEIKLLITDFDGTLVDTFEANYRAYNEAFKRNGLELTRIQYRDCFGYRFDKFMQAVGIDDGNIKERIRSTKRELYTKYFDLLKPNNGLLKLLRHFHATGGKTAVASTATRENLMNALTHIGAIDDFDLILSGESVKYGKPNPEIYNKVLDHFSIMPGEALVFEDSEIGCTAANTAGISVVRVS